jgi:hypothetical protein
MPWRREALQQEHPKMRHEIARDAIVGTVEQNIQGEPPPLWWESLMSRRAGRADGTQKVIPESIDIDPESFTPLSLVPKSK